MCPRCTASGLGRIKPYTRDRGGDHICFTPRELDCRVFLSHGSQIVNSVPEQLISCSS